MAAIQAAHFEALLAAITSHGAPAAFDFSARPPRGPCTLRAYAADVFEFSVQRVAGAGSSKLLVWSNHL